MGMSSFRGMCTSACASLIWPSALLAKLTESPTVAGRAADCCLVHTPARAFPLGSRWGTHATAQATTLQRITSHTHACRIGPSPPDGAESAPSAWLSQSYHTPSPTCYNTRRHATRPRRRHSVPDRTRHLPRRDATAPAAIRRPPGALPPAANARLEWANRVSLRCAAHFIAGDCFHLPGRPATWQLPAR